MGRKNIKCKERRSKSQKVRGRIGTTVKNKLKNNASYIKRSKQMEDIHKKMQLIEQNQRYKNFNTEIQNIKLLEGNGGSFITNAETEAEQTYNELLSGFKCGDENAGDLNENFRNKCDDTQQQHVTNNNKKVVSILHRDDEDLTLQKDKSKNIYQLLSDHFNYILSSDDVENLILKKSKIIQSKFNMCGKLQIEVPNITANDINKTKSNFEESDANKANDLLMHVKSPLCANTHVPLTQLQSELFHIFNGYYDFYFPQSNLQIAEEIRSVYCLHALNHMLKSKAIILRNNEKLSSLAKSMKVHVNDVTLTDNFRDQGLTRLKIVILVPFRNSALKIVNSFAQLLYGTKADISKKNGTITNYKRFFDDFSGNTLIFPKTNRKPLDYELTFCGNTDDNFKVGIRFIKKSMFLFSDLDSSDILICSPLALRMHINSSENKTGDYDFLNSIELLIIDQAELFYAQNWETFLYTLNHFHLQPQKISQTNCQRVRTSCLGGLAKFYRQTLMFSSHELPEFRSVINKKCHNYKGCVRVTNSIINGDISNVVIPVKQVFRRVHSENVESVFNDRFDYFVKNILPQFKSVCFSHCLIYVPSYFDYVRLRNYLKDESISFVQISEYTSNEKISRARDMFFHSGAHFMLYSERAHFYRRTRIKGIRHIIMYQPPNWPNFYSEIINMMLETNQNVKDGLQNSMSITVLYTKYDAISINNIIGTEAALKLTQSNKLSYIFSNENSSQ